MTDSLKERKNVMLMPKLFCSPRIGGRSVWRLCVVATLVAAAALPTTPAYGTPETGDASGRCIRTSTAVADTSIIDGTQQVRGTLCLPAAEKSRSQTIQLLLSGGTYNHNYWDFPYQKKSYSYVDYMLKSGQPTWNVDLMGTGDSSEPPGATLTPYAQAAMVHQLVSKLKSGQIEGQSFDKVVLAGHSLGTTISWIEAAQYHDVDGVIATGMLHPDLVLNPGALPKYTSVTYPAPLEPNPRVRTADPGYLTTIPGTRGGPLFYNARNADPAVQNVDEQTKDVLAVASLGLFVTPIIDRTSKNIQVPVLVAVGEKDAVGTSGCEPRGLPGAVDCSSAESVHEHEAAYYSPEARLQTYVQPDSGHAMNLHKNARDWFGASASWVATTVGG